MAKDGTARGGARMGGGRKPKPLADKINDGDYGVTVMNLPEGADLKGEDMPEPKDYMRDRQKAGTELCAEEVFKETWLWLKARGCEKFVSRELVDHYAMSVSRWIQCERAISQYGFLAKHPTTNNPIASPYVAMSQQYMKQVNQLWFQIYQIVKENCTIPYQGGTPQDSVMERLLRSRNGG